MIFFSTKGVAIIRPPGHHAEADEACGFCIFNNVPVAGMYLFCSKKYISTLPNTNCHRCAYFSCFM